MSIKKMPNEVLDHILSLIWSPYLIPEFLEMRLVSWQFDSLISHITLQHATQSDLDIGRKTHWRHSIGWMLATKARSHFLDAQGPFAFLRDAVEYLLENRVVPQLPVDKIIVAACRAIVAVQEPSWVVNHLVTWQPDKSLPQPISHLDTYVCREGNASSPTNSQSPEAFYGILQLLLACGSEAAAKIDSVINGSATLNTAGSISCHPLFGHPMHTAIVMEEVVEMQTLLNRVDLDAIDFDGKGTNALIYAAEINRKKAVRLLLCSSICAQINARGGSGLTILGWAARRGWTSIVQLLLQRDDINVDIGNCEDETPLAEAAKKDYDDIAHLLMAKTSVIIGSERSCPLRVAFEYGATRVLRLFLDRFGDEIDLNQETLDGHTPLTFAIKKGFTDFVHMLLEVPGVNPDQPDSKKGLTPLAWAVKKRQIEIARHLLNLNVDVTKESRDMIPIEIALRNRDLAMVGLLMPKTLNTYNTSCLMLLFWPNSVRNILVALQHLGQSEQFRKDHPRRFDEVLRDAALAKQPAIVREVLKLEEVDVNATSLYGQRPLLAAATRPSSSEIIKLMLTRKDVDVNVRGGDGKTALMMVTGQGDISSMKALMEYPGIDLNLETPPFSETVYFEEGSEKFSCVVEGRGQDAPLLAAARENLDDAFELLYQDPRTTQSIFGPRGKTPLWWAVWHSNKRMLKKNFDHTPRVRDSINARDTDGYAPIHIAISHGDFEITKMLISHPDIDINAVSRYDSTALHMSMETCSKRRRLSLLLLNHPNIDTSIESKDGQTAFDLHEGCECGLLSEFSQASL